MKAIKELEIDEYVWDGIKEAYRHIPDKVVFDIDFIKKLYFAGVDIYKMVWYDFWHSLYKLAEAGYIAVAHRNRFEFRQVEENVRRRLIFRLEAILITSELGLIYDHLDTVLDWLGDSKKRITNIVDKLLQS